MARKNTRPVQNDKRNNISNISSKSGGRIVKKQNKNDVITKSNQSKCITCSKVLYNFNKNKSCICNVCLKKEAKSSTKLVKAGTSNVSTITSKVKNSSPKRDRSGSVASKSSSPKSNSKRSSSNKKSPSLQSNLTKRTVDQLEQKSSSKPATRGKKRSYAELASGISSIDENSPKKKKGDKTSKATTVRESRNKKPTAKASEWLNTIQSKKTTSSSPSSSKPAKSTKESKKKNKSSPKTVKSDKSNVSKAPARTSSAKNNSSKKPAEPNKVISKRLNKRTVVKNKNLQNQSPVKQKTPPKSNVSPKKMQKVPIKTNTKSSPKNSEKKTPKKGRNNRQVKEQNRSIESDTNESSSVKDGVTVVKDILQNIFNSLGSNEDSTNDGSRNLDENDSSIIKVLDLPEHEEPLDKTEETKRCVDSEIVGLSPSKRNQDANSAINVDNLSDDVHSENIETTGKLISAESLSDEKMETDQIPSCSDDLEEPNPEGSTNLDMKIDTSQKENRVSEVGVDEMETDQSAVATLKDKTEDKIESLGSKINNQKIVSCNETNEDNMETPQVVMLDTNQENSVSDNKELCVDSSINVQKNVDEKADQPRNKINEDKCNSPLSEILPSVSDFPVRDDAKTNQEAVIDQKQCSNEVGKSEYVQSTGDSTYPVQESIVERGSGIESVKQENEVDPKESTTCNDQSKETVSVIEGEAKRDEISENKVDGDIILENIVEGSNSKEIHNEEKINNSCPATLVEESCDSDSVTENKVNLSGFSHDSNNKLSPSQKLTVSRPEKTQDNVANVSHIPNKEISDNMNIKSGDVNENEESRLASFKTDHSVEIVKELQGISEVPENIISNKSQSNSIEQSVNSVNLKEKPLKDEFVTDINETSNEIVFDERENDVKTDSSVEDAQYIQGDSKVSVSNILNKNNSNSLKQSTDHESLKENPLRDQSPKGLSETSNKITYDGRDDYKDSIQFETSGTTNETHKEILIHGDKSEDKPVSTTPDSGKPSPEKLKEVNSEKSLNSENIISAQEKDNEIQGEILIRDEKSVEDKHVFTIPVCDKSLPEKLKKVSSEENLNSENISAQEEGTFQDVSTLDSENSVKEDNDFKLQMESESENEDSSKDVSELNLEISKSVENNKKTAGINTNNGNASEKFDESEIKEGTCSNTDTSKSENNLTDIKDSLNNPEIESNFSIESYKGKKVIENSPKENALVSDLHGQHIENTSPKKDTVQGISGIGIKINFNPATKTISANHEINNTIDIKIELQNSQTPKDTSCSQAIVNKTIEDEKELKKVSCLELNGRLSLNEDVNQFSGVNHGVPEKSSSEVENEVSSEHKRLVCCVTNGIDTSKKEHLEKISEEPIDVDDTDVESMQCNSETRSSHRMSVDDDNTAMDLDVEDGCDVNPKYEMKLESELKMEVS